MIYDPCKTMAKLWLRCVMCDNVKVHS
ncbi:hypothetical protein F383_30210 [Gossypium arboreum]|uniref:Uncharacterized protein n=1 Tax=Gossypium arboreum TaxID=29729 RepID=A0A0B0P706_GOSAR|nr:hypothetical protein F383_30210 [Gossypium arboreum]